MVEILLYNSRILFQASIATAAAVIEEHPYVHVSEYQPDVPGISDRRRTGTLLFPLKNTISCTASCFL